MKSLFISILFLFSINSSFSQEKEQKKGQLEGIIGLSGTGYSSDALGTNAYSHSYSFHIGVTYQYHLSNKFSLKSGFIFSPQGDRDSAYENIAVPIGETIREYNVNYINIPLDFTYHIKDYRIFTGPQLGIFIGQENIASLLGDVNPIDYGISLGFGKVFEDKLSINLRLYQGLAKVYKTTYQEINTVNLAKATNQVMQISFGYIFM